MAAIRRPASRFRLLVVVLVLISLTFVSLDATGNSAVDSARRVTSDILNPIQDGIHDALRPVGNFLTGAVDYGSVQAENARLRRELAALRNQEASSAYLIQQAEQALEEEHLPFVGSIKQVAAQVTDVGSSNFEQTITIGKGTASGLQVGQPVVTAGGLAGSVSEVEAHSATVTLLSEANFTVGVSLPGHNVGVATGQGYGDDLTVTVVPTGVAAPKVKKGMILSTSGLSMENFPGGIPVGRVVSYSTPAGETDPVISVAPLVDAASMQVVQVLLWSPQTSQPGS